MQAPVSERPKVNELKELMTKLEDYFSNMARLKNLRIYLNAEKNKIQLN